MNADPLTAALTAHVPDVDAVLARMETKRSVRRRRRLLLVSAAAAVALLVAGGVWWWPPGPAPARRGSPVGPPAQVADGCAVIPLPEVIADAKATGASVILANGVLTGRTAQDGILYDEMVLSSVRTLAGPRVSSGSRGWVSGQRGPSGPVPGADTGSLWAPDGGLFAIVTPRATGAIGGPMLRIAPLVGDQVILSSAGCWDTGGVAVRPFTGRLNEIPGSDSYARTRARGLFAVPLKTVRAAAARSGS